MRPALASLAVVLLVTPPVAAQVDPEWEFLSTSTIGADRFLDAHPEWDGRGVLIAICDSGVELGLPGLETTTTGAPKILDAREFTDEGRFGLKPAERGEDEHGAALFAGDGRWLYGIDALEPAPPDEDEILVGYVDEADFVNNEVGDLNSDGDATDVFGLVAYAPAGTGEDEPWVAFLDTDADGDLDDEVPLHDFAVAREAFGLGGHERHAEAQAVTYALNLWPEEREAALFFDGNGHGTHVAGIASGHDLNGQEGYDGIAPGAQLLALKIGNNSYSGGATTPGSMIEAWRYAVDKADELGMPLVIQMSYGVGSEDEGRSDADRLISELLADHPGVVATLSAGNDGPGLSTVGFPSPPEALSVGAALARTTAARLYGIDLPTDRMFYFSARGGELAKPDLVCPGFAASAIPDWTEGRNVMRGTSMAAPQAAGAAALLYSAALAQDLPAQRRLARGALVGTAKALPGYGVLTQGAGMADVPAAWDAYRLLAEREELQPLRWEVRASSPEMDGRPGPTVFYRGAFYPRGEERVDVEVEPVFADDAREGEVQRFYRAFRLEAEADWVRVDTPEVYVKQRAPAEIRLGFDPSRLAEPGLYQTRLVAWEKGLGRSERDTLGPAFTIPVAVAVPHAPGGEGRVVSRTPELGPAQVHRVFLPVRPWTGGLRYEVELDRATGDREAGVSLYDPEGREILVDLASPESPVVSTTVPPHRLEPGIWELVVWGRQDNRGPVRAEVRGFLPPLARTAGPDLELEHPAGRAPAGTLTIATALDSTWRGSGSGAVVGAVDEETVAIDGARWSRPLRLAPGEDAVELYLEMPQDEWGLFTDLAVQVLGPDGTALVSSAFGTSKVDVEFAPPDDADPDTEYTLQLLAAPADPDASPAWTLTVREVHLYSEPVPAEVLQDGETDLTLFPYRPAELDLELGRTPPQPPDGWRWLVELDLEPDDPRRPSLALDLEAR